MAIQGQITLHVGLDGIHMEIDGGIRMLLVGMVHHDVLQHRWCRRHHIRHFDSHNWRGQRLVTKGVVTSNAVAVGTHLRHIILIHIHTVVWQLVFTDSCQRNVGVLVQFFPGAALRVLTLNVKSRIIVTRPVEHSRQRRLYGVRNLDIERLWLPCAEHRAKRGVAIDEHHRVRYVWINDVTVAHAFLSRTVDIHQTHRFGQVGTQLCYHHGHTHHALLFVVDFHNGIVRIAGLRLT